MKQLPPIIATAGQHEFALTGQPIFVTVNGLVIQPADWATDGEKVTLVKGVGAGDEVGAVVA